MRNGPRTMRRSPPRTRRTSIIRSSGFSRSLNGRAPQFLQRLDASLRWFDQKSARLALFAAVAASVLVGKSLFLGFGGEFFRHLALFLDDHVSALRHAEGLLEQAEMIELRPGGMLE